MNQATLQPITETLTNTPISTAEAHYQSEYDRLTKQIYFDGEYWQLYVKKGIIINVINMKQRWLRKGDKQNESATYFNTR